MKKLILLVLAITLSPTLAQEPNDCYNYIQACGNREISLDVSGSGKIQEITGKGCSSGENNSLWLRLTIESAGTLGFTLKPTSLRIEEDYDFWVFGPDVDCDNIPRAVRCSTTNPYASGQGNNWTGMNGSEDDYSEGPGHYGNSFVRWLDVEVGESYFLVIDRPIGTSSFNLEWTGTAKLENPLEDVIINQLQEQKTCDLNADGVENFDFDSLISDILDDTTGLSVTFHESESDAFIGSNHLNNSTPVSTGTYWYRVENVATGCFEINTFQLQLDGLLLNEPEVVICDIDNDLFENVNLESYTLYESDNPIASKAFYLTEVAAIAGGTDNISNPENFELNEQTMTIFARVVDENGCVGITPLKFNLLTQPNSINLSNTYCLSQLANGLNIYNEKDLFTTNSNQVVTYYFSQTDLENDKAIDSNVINLNLGTTTLLVEVTENGCSKISYWDIIVIEDLDIGEMEVIELCAAEFPYEIKFDQNFDTYEWDNGSQENAIVVETFGDYQLTVTNDIGCSASKIYRVIEKPLPLIENVQLNEKNQLNVTVAGDTDGLQYQLNDGPWQNNPNFTLEVNGYYIIRVRTLEGCIAEYTGFNLSAINNFITPNGDGLNDYFDLRDINLGEQHATLEIYNRYGKKLFSANQHENLIWDGKYLGRLMPTGTYYYIFKINGEKDISGYITLKTYGFE